MSTGGSNRAGSCKAFRKRLSFHGTISSQIKRVLPQFSFMDSVENNARFSYMDSKSFWMHLYLGYMEVMSAVKEENMKL